MRHCFYCHGPLTEDEVYCGGCGQPTDYTTEILERAAHGDYNIQHELYDRTQESVQQEIRRLIPDRTQAGEVFQTTYVTAFRQLGRLQDPHAFPQWLLAVTRAMADRALAPEGGVQSRDPIPEPDPEPAPAPSTVRDQAGTDPEAEALLSGLPEDQRAVVSLAYYDKMDLPDIAEALGISQGEVRTRMFQARDEISRKTHRSGADRRAEGTNGNEPPEEMGETDPGTQLDGYAAYRTARKEETAAEEHRDGEKPDQAWTGADDSGEAPSRPERAHSDRRTARRSRRVKPEQSTSEDHRTVVILTVVAVVVVLCVAALVALLRR